MARFPVLLACLAACGDTLTDVPPADATDGDADTDADADADADADTDSDTDADVLRFVAHVVASVEGPVFADVGDVTGDGTPDIVVSSLGVVTEADVPPGVVTLYELGADLDTWTASDVIPAAAGLRYPNHPTPADLDGDGDLDLVVPSGGRLCGNIPQAAACGGLQWLENTGGGWTPHVLFQGSPAFYNAVRVIDLDGDGLLDLVTSAEFYTPTAATSRIEVFRGTGPGTFTAQPLQLETGGPWPEVEDVDGDGALDVLVGERYTADSFAWYRNDAGRFTRHVIASDLGDGFQIASVADLYGDGVRRVVATNHTNTVSPEAPDTIDAQAVAFEIPSDPTQPWSVRDTLSSGIVASPDVPLFPLDAPGTFASGDLDGDGDVDLVVAGASDPAVYLLDQTAPGTFETRVLRDDLPGSGGTRTVDFDGDGDLEMVVVSERNDAVYVISRE